MSKEQGQTAASGTLGFPGTIDLVSQPSRFTKLEKWFIVGFSAFVGLFRQALLCLA